MMTCLLVLLRTFPFFGFGNLILLVDIARCYVTTQQKTERTKGKQANTYLTYFSWLSSFSYCYNSFMCKRDGNEDEERERNRMSWVKKGVSECVWVESWYATELGIHVCIWLLLLYEAKSSWESWVFPPSMCITQVWCMYVVLSFVLCKKRAIEETRWFLFPQDEKGEKRIE